MAESEVLAGEMIRVCRRELDQCLLKIVRAVETISAEDLWSRAHENENAVGNLLLHLAGNVRQWITAGLGGAADRRDRDSEFSRRDELPAQELLRGLRSTLREADQVLAGMTADKLLARYSIQGFEVTGVYAVLHVTEHFGEHTGQILWIAKHASGEDLGLFAKLAGSGKASGGEPTVR